MEIIDKILRELRDMSGVIADLEIELKPLRDRRDRLLVKAMQLGYNETNLAKLSGVSRGWTHTLKKRSGYRTRPYKDSRTTAGHIRRLEEKLDRAKRSRDDKIAKGMYADLGEEQ